MSAFIHSISINTPNSIKFDIAIQWNQTTVDQFRFRLFFFGTAQNKWTFIRWKRKKNNEHKHNEPHWMHWKFLLNLSTCLFQWAHLMRFNLLNIKWAHHVHGTNKPMCKTFSVLYYYFKSKIYYAAQCLNNGWGRGRGRLQIGHKSNFILIKANF